MYLSIICIYSRQVPTHNTSFFKLTMGLVRFVCVFVLKYIFAGKYGIDTQVVNFKT